MSTSKFNQIITLSLLGLGLTACGGGSGGSGPKIYSGVFKADKNVTGVSFVSGGQKSITGKNGEFKFEENGNISFSVGGVSLGSAKAKNVMTPLDLVPNGKVDSIEVVNRVRFLKMLDKDNDENNGIEVSKKVLEKAKKSWNTIKFNKDFPSDKAGDIRLDASLEDGVRHDYPSFGDAKDRFQLTINAIKATVRCHDSGAFTGAYTGSEKGNIAFMLDPTTDGKVIGSIFNKGTPIEVTSKTAMDYDTKTRNFVSEGLQGKIFTGKLVSGNVLKGTWVSKNDAKKKGDFEAKRLGGNSGATYRYTAVYEGKDTTDKGIIAIDVYSDNKLKGKLYDVKTNKAVDITGKVKDAELIDVKLTDGGKMKGDVISESLEAYIVGKTRLFTANRCKLSK